MAIKNKVGEKFFDLFSIGHIILGFFMYWATLSISDDVVPFQIAQWFSVVFVFGFSLFWEIFENCTKLGMKVRSIKKVDTLQNSLGDVLFAFIGSIICFLLPIFLNF